MRFLPHFIRFLNKGWNTLSAFVMLYVTFQHSIWTAGGQALLCESTFFTQNAANGQEIGDLAMGAMFLVMPFPVTYFWTYFTAGSWQLNVLLELALLRALILPVWQRLWWDFKLIRVFLLTTGLAAGQYSQKVQSLQSCWEPAPILRFECGYCILHWSSCKMCHTKLFLSTWDNSARSQQNILGSVFIFENYIFFRENMSVFGLEMFEF